MADTLHLHGAEQCLGCNQWQLLACWLVLCDSLELDRCPTNGTHCAQLLLPKHTHTHAPYLILQYSCGFGHDPSFHHVIHLILHSSCLRMALDVY